MIKRKSKKFHLVNKSWIIATVISALLVFLFFFFVSAQGSGSEYGFLVELQTPENGSVEFDGNVVFAYEITNSSYTMNNCSFIFNGLINQTETNISSSSTNYFYLNNLQNGEYNWSVNCSWPSSNISASEDRVLRVFNDTTSPVVIIQSPSNGTSSTDRVMEFNYSVNDDGWIINCSIYTDVGGTWKVNQTNPFVIKNITQTFQLNLPDETTFKWNILCYDFASLPNSAWATSNRTAIIHNPAPLLSGIPAQTWDEDSIKTLNLSSYASDSDNDKLTYNSSSPSHISVELDEDSGEVILTPQINWYGSEDIIFYVYDSDGDVNSSQILLTVAQEGDTSPRFVNIAPEDNYQDGDGYLFLTTNVTDDYALSNISLYSDTSGTWQLEETIGLSGTNELSNFSLPNVSEGNYNYAFLVYDNNSQSTWSENRTINVAIEVALDHDISNYTVNHIDHNRTILARYSGYLNDSIVLGDLKIYLSNGSLYYNKNLSGSGFEINLPEPLIVSAQKIRIKYDEIFYGDFTLGNEEWINISLDYSYLGDPRQISTIHTIEVIE